MNTVITLILAAIAIIILLKLIFKITSFFVKLLLEFLLIVAVLYFVNYYILPKLKISPLPLKEKISSVIKHNKELKTQIETSLPKIKNEIEYAVLPETKKIVTEVSSYLSKTKSSNMEDRK